jgi:hypothetical protein
MTLCCVCVCVCVCVWLVACRLRVIVNVRFSVCVWECSISFAMPLCLRVC